MIFLTSKNEKLKCLHLKALGIHVYLTTIKESYFVNCKHLEVITKALNVLKSILNDDYLFRVSNFDSAFVVWNTLVSLGEQKHITRGVTRMMEVLLSIYATWSKGMTPLR